MTEAEAVAQGVHAEEGEQDAGPLLYQDVDIPNDFSEGEEESDDLPEQQPKPAAAVNGAASGAPGTAATGDAPSTSAAAATAGPGGAQLCAVCGSTAARYRCPGCELRSCSLACSKAHKESSGCSGKRDRLKFVSLQEFDDRTLLSDYRLLEEVHRAEDVAKRCRPPAARPQLPPHLQSLVYQAGRRRVKLLVMPPGMHKRKTNTTRYDGRTRKLSWRVEWVFEGAGVRQADESVQEDATLGEVLAKHLTYAPGMANKQFPLRAYADAVADAQVAAAKAKAEAEAAAAKEAAAAAAEAGGAQQEGAAVPEKAAAEAGAAGEAPMEDVDMQQAAAAGVDGAGDVPPTEAGAGAAAGTEADAASTHMPQAAGGEPEAAAAT
eukprot:CAMPEP_0202880592 /NCGR_PEP_ID=MMETSP1391-20130828/35271_1 /ASSEMBLY_ACC=CAM_ASM_000867 /TAXON_ID=1034604 /ORGANISM="Chlamydomonas leiostraca, Strain SAG 11-49" /LENGTH=378 /DNA_ID=CAMNT_0049563117 /DNA_START=104 /DNA_END=1237 /DNA_ORIENTATION=+